MKITRWLSVFVLAIGATFMLGCQPAGESTGGSTVTAPEGSSGTASGSGTDGSSDVGGGVETPMDEETAAPATDESAPVDDAPADDAPADE